MGDAAGSQLEAFLTEHFPGMRLHPGGYGEWPHLRFELGDPLPVEAGPERAEQAAGRAAAIFESVFAEGDIGFISFTRWLERDDAVFAALVPASTRAVVERRDGIDYYEQGEDVPYTTHTAEISPRSFDYSRCFRLIANSELGQSPSLGGRVYFLNRSNRFVFHMYDDRGAILFAADPSQLGVLRSTFSDWLVAA